MADPNGSAPAYPAGPWDGEPDFKLWTDESSGYRCLIRRVSHSGHLCGYVEVPEGHGLCGAHYRDSVEADLSERKIDQRTNYLDVFIHACEGNENTASLSIAVHVHGGLTFSGPRCVDAEGQGEEVGHWFGFDCAHLDDLSPRSASDPIWGEGVYRDLAYVERECAYLAKQLRELADAKVLPRSSDDVLAELAKGAE